VDTDQQGNTVGSRIQGIASTSSIPLSGTRTRTHAGLRSRIVAIVVIVCYARIFWYIRKTFREIASKMDRESAQRTQQMNSKVLGKLGAFPVLFVICFTPATLNRLWATIDPESVPAILSSLHVGFISLAGFFHSCVYSWKNWRKIAAELGKRWGLKSIYARYNHELTVPLTDITE
jgi:hypothetical protein